MTSDADIVGFVEEVLRQEMGVAASDVAVAANGDVVLLAGFVRSYGHKMQAEQAAKRVPGVFGLANDIEVRLPSADWRPDPEIARDAVAAIRRDLPYVDTIEVVVADGVVTLEGWAESNDWRAKAELAVRWLRGVRNVHNAIRVVERPGSITPAHEQLPRVYIHQSTTSAMQSGPLNVQGWLLAFEPWSPQRLDPLMGWAGSRDPFTSLGPMRFPDRRSAIEFAEQHGWSYVVKEPPRQPVRPKSYADNFRYHR